MSRIFYTADLHFGHKNIIKYENRPFEDVEDMNEQLIKKWNKKVKPNDTVYILGDFAFPNSKLTCRDIEDIVNKLNGEKILITGNHDSWVSKKAFNTKCFKQIVPYAEIYDTSVKRENPIVILFHYPIEDWDGRFYEAIHLHGHIHSNEISYAKNRYNVGVDVCNYEPVTLEEIIKLQGKIK